MQWHYTETDTVYINFMQQWVIRALRSDLECLRSHNSVINICLSRIQSFISIAVKSKKKERNHYF
jgi:hypothetical protein